MEARWNRIRMQCTRAEAAACVHCMPYPPPAAGESTAARDRRRQSVSSQFALAAAARLDAAVRAEQGEDNSVDDADEEAAALDPELLRLKSSTARALGSDARERARPTTIVKKGKTVGGTRHCHPVFTRARQTPSPRVLKKKNLVSQPPDA